VPAAYCGQVGWLAPVENGLRDVRSEIAEADEPREVGWTDTFLLGQCGKRRPAAARECGVEAVRPDQQLDQSSVGLCGGKRVGPADQHPDLPSRLAQPHRHGQDLGFVVGLIRQWRGWTIEERAEPCRAEMDIDLVGADVDAFHQTGKQGALSAPRENGLPPMRRPDAPPAACREGAGGFQPCDRSIVGAGACGPREAALRAIAKSSVADARPNLTVVARGPEA
jgi:hypothetical protein